ncbi:MAG: twin-arginine translocase subunit TatC [Opitutus sp.]|nr:twin-arginine translocase subunit TatC [Opitutus sp.]MCS6248026.1 twin-arginine translocase subunit TatC [Opitutus sp.]MCS6274429.1 twin-arginine translocase subunit TatC [Opitutus sp.]MCS6278723.1 twin-arginine translocase subunit TatC [Opitutus sp.]MCS6299699.1 twin-arginine translocase subunit TatC [Opitutus sp.]
MSQPSLDDDESPAAGDRKTFWAHLDDLRKALIRSAIAVCIALFLCLFISDKLMNILEYPIRHMNMFEKPKPTVTFQIGDAKMGPYTVAPEQFKGLPEGTAPQVVFNVGSAVIDGKQVATLELDTQTPISTETTRVKLHNFGPAEGFFLAFRISIYGGLILSCPFWAYFMGSFIFPAFNLNEKKIIFQWVGWGTLLFLAGISLTYFLLLPIALRASIEYSQLMGFDAYTWRADEYIKFVTHFLLGMGLGFQFPVIVLILVKIGVLTHHQLGKYRRHVVVLSLILGALLTTPEVITQISMAVPLYILYEISIWIAWYWDWKKRKAARLAGDIDI